MKQNGFTNTAVSLTTQIFESIVSHTSGRTFYMQSDRWLDDCISV